MTNVKDVLHNYLTLPFMTYQQSKGNTTDMQCFNFLVPYLFQSYACVSNRFNDRNHQTFKAALLTRCYIQHALRPLIDSENNHKVHFIKFSFINKGIDFTDLPCIFLDKSVTSNIPDYFQNSEPPIIWYKYSKPFEI